MNTEFVNWKLIGKGAFAIVYLAEEKYSHVKYAIKVIPIKKMNQQELRLFNNEKSILRTTTYYNFKHIVKLVNVIKDPTNYLLVLEYCNGGSLHDSLYKYINKYGKPIPEDLVKYLMKQIITEIKCLHNIGVIHRDLKLANILLKYNNNIDKDNLNLFAAEIRITDFNVSYIPNNSEIYGQQQWNLFRCKENYHAEDVSCKPDYCYETCETCDEISNNIDDQKCSSCKTGYKLDNGNCILIPSIIVSEKSTTFPIMPTTSPSLITIIPFNSNTAHLTSKINLETNESILETNIISTIPNSQNNRENKIVIKINNNLNKLKIYQEVR